ncbi:MAG TPA: GAF domain-containing protein, partial [Anaerolineae bacterium]|nr:GAF domain-containing protein [Anaerolineae bacterium]
MGKDSRIPTGMYQLSPELKEKLMNINGPLGDVNDVADQLAYAVTGSFDFSVQVQSNDPTVQKLSIMVNFLLETIRRTVNELETKHKFLMETTQTLQESEERFRAMMQSASDAKEAEERIEKSNSLLNATFESIADGIVVVDLAGQTVAFNQKFAQMWDIPDSIIGNTQERLVFIGSQLKNPNNFWQRAEELANQSEAEGYDILELNDGRVIERHSKPQWLGDQVVGRVWNFRDITEQKQAEAILRQNEASMAAAQRIAHLGNWVSNLQTGHLHWSDEIYRIFGLAPQEFSATVDAFFSRVHPDDLAYVNKALEEAMARHKDYNVNHRIVRDNGEVRFVHQEAEITFDEAGKPLQMFGIVQDVTDRRQLELKIQESLERRGRQVQLSTEMAQEIAAATNLNDLYQRVVLQVKTQFDYYYTQLLRYDPAQNVIELVVGYGEVGAQMLAQGYSLPLGVGLIGMAAATGKSILQSDIAADPDWRPNLLLPDTKGELAVPIKLGEQVLGVLDVQSNMTGSLDADDQLVLEGLCGQIAVAIESIQLRQEMEDRLRELNALQRLMSREGWQTFMATRERAVPGYIFDQTSVRPLTGDELGLHGNDVSQKEPTVGTTTSNGHHLVAKPLAVRGEIIGSLGIQDDGDDPLAPEDQAFLDAVTEQVAEALERARLLEQTQKRAMEMETLSQISRRLSAVLDPQQLIAEVVEQVGVAFNYYYTQIYLFDQARENLVLAGGSGETGRLLLARQHSLPKGRGLVGRAAEQNKTVLIPDVRRSIRPEIINQANLEDVYRRETDPVVEAQWYAQYMAHYFGDVKVVRDWLTVNPERTGKALKLGYVLHVPGAFSKMIRRGVEAAARDLQVEVEFVAPVRQGEHLSLFEAMVRQGKDGLVVVPDQPDWVEPIRQAMTVNIPVVTANRDLKFSPALMHVGLDNFQAGVMLARELVKLFQAAGQKKGKILVGTGIADRNAGVRHVLRDTNYTLIEIEGFLEDASFLQTYWEQALSRHPDLI